MESTLYLTKVLAKIFSRHSPPQVYEMLQQVFTEKELVYLENRLRIAFMLRQGKSYSQIQQELKVSAATVAVVAEQMKEPQFAKLVDKVEKEMTRFAWLKQRISL